MSGFRQLRPQSLQVTRQGQVHALNCILFKKMPKISVNFLPQDNIFTQTGNRNVKDATIICMLFSGDQVSRSVLTYAESESINTTTKAALTDFAANFSAIQDYREAEVSPHINFSSRLHLNNSSVNVLR